MATTQDEMKDIKETVAHLQDMLSDRIEQTPANGKSKSHINTADIQATAKNAGKKLRSYVDDKREKLGSAKEQCEDRIKEHPFQSAAIAFAGGALLASLLRRK